MTTQADDTMRSIGDVRRRCGDASNRVGTLLRAVDQIDGKLDRCFFLAQDGLLGDDTTTIVVSKATRVAETLESVVEILEALVETEGFIVR